MKLVIAISQALCGEILCMNLEYTMWEHEFVQQHEFMELCFFFSALYRMMAQPGIWAFTSFLLLLQESRLLLYHQVKWDLMEGNFGTWNDMHHIELEGLA